MEIITPKHFIFKTKCSNFYDIQMVCLYLLPPPYRLDKTDSLWGKAKFFGGRVPSKNGEKRVNYQFPQKAKCLPNRKWNSYTVPNHDSLFSTAFSVGSGIITGQVPLSSKHVYLYIFNLILTIIKGIKIAWSV